MFRMENDSLAAWMNTGLNIRVIMPKSSDLDNL